MELRQRAGRRFVIRINTVVAVMLALAILGMVNYLSLRQYRRVDVSRSQVYALSPKTIALLDSLTNRVDITVFVTAEHHAYQDIENLLAEYAYASPHLHVERVRPYRDLARTEELAAKYDVKLLDVVVFEHEGRTKYVNADSVIEMDHAMALMGEPPTRTAFHGELQFSSAIQSITSSKKPVAYLLRGHGERDVEDFDQHRGFSDLAQVIRRDNIELKTVTLGESKSLPDDCDVLIVAGPEKKMSQPEIDILSRYLQENGRMLLMADASTHSGLEPVMEDWGLRLQNDVVIDGTRTLTGRELFVTEYGRHQVAHHLQGVASILYFPRSVVPLSGETADDSAEDKPTVTSLAFSSEAGWAETDFDQNPMQFDPQFDTPGPVSVAAAVERGPVEGIDIQIRPTRLVVFGDSDFVSNGGMSGGNEDFFMSSLNWLLERDDHMALAPKPLHDMRLVMSGPQLRLLFLALTAGLPGAVAILGVIVWLRRRV